MTCLTLRKVVVRSSAAFSILSLIKYSPGAIPVSILNTWEKYLGERLTAPANSGSLIGRSRLVFMKSITARTLARLITFSVTSNSTSHACSMCVRENATVELRFCLDLISESVPSLCQCPAMGCICEPGELGSPMQRTVSDESDQDRPIALGSEALLLLAVLLLMLRYKA